MGSKTETIHNIQAVNILREDYDFSDKLLEVATKFNNVGEELIKDFVTDRTNLIGMKSLEKLGLIGVGDFNFFDITEESFRRAVKRKFGNNAELLSVSDEFKVYNDLAVINQYIFENEKYDYTYTKEFERKLKTKIPINSKADIIKSRTDLEVFNSLQDKQDVSYDHKGYYLYHNGDKKYLEKKENGYYYNSVKNQYGFITKQYFHSYFFIPEYEALDENYKFVIPSFRQRIIQTIYAISEEGKPLVYYVPIDEYFLPVYSFIPEDRRALFEGKITKERIKKYIPNDERTYYAIKYNRLGYTEANFIAKDELTRFSILYSKCLLFVIKKDFEMIDDSDTKNKAGLLRFAIYGDSFDEIKNNSELKTFFLTYASKKNEPFYDELRDMYLSSSTTIVNKNMKVEYFGKASARRVGQVNEQEKKLYMAIDGAKQEVDFVIIPLEFMNQKGLKNFYDDFSKHLKGVALSEKTIKLKWYQTGFFSFVMKVIAIGTAIFTGGSSLAILTTAGLIIASEVLPPEIAIIVDIAFTIYSMYYVPTTGTNAVINKISIASKISADIFKLHSTMEVKKYIKQIQEYSEETKKMQEEILDLAPKKIILDPFSDLMYEPDRKFYIAYDFMYNDIYDLSTTSRIEGF